MWIIQWQTIGETEWVNREEVYLSLEKAINTLRERQEWDSYENNYRLVACKVIELID